MSNISTTEIINIIAAVVNTAVKLGPTVIKGVEDATPFAKAIYGLFTGTNVTEAQLDDLVKKIKTLSEELQKPLPQEEEENVEDGA